MRASIFILVAGTLLATQASAEITRVIDNSVAPNTVKAVKIVYTGWVNQIKITNLSSVIDEINQKYKNAQNIYLYINSDGGEMDSGKAGYDVIHSSPIPVTTVNMSDVASSATMLYCGAKSRLVLENIHFKLHAPTISISGSKNTPANEINLSENDITLKNEDINKYRNMLKNIYKSCTTLSDEQIDKITYSEEHHDLLNNQQAMDIKLATGEAKSIISTEASYYIHDL